jgi:hypothetical protein
LHRPIVSPGCVAPAVQVCEAVRTSCCASLSGADLALGYLHRGHLVLAPPMDGALVFVPGDKLVVLSESFL